MWSFYTASDWRLVLDIAEYLDSVDGIRTVLGIYGVNSG